MLTKRRKVSSAFGPDGRRIGGTATAASSSHSTNGSSIAASLFAPGTKLQVHRVPIMNGLNISKGLQKRFQRPMLKRRAYNKMADEALKRASLGPRRRFDGMAKLMARAGKGLHFASSKSSMDEQNKDGTDGSGESDEDEEEEDRPFEPLMVWKSPHQGGEAKGLPSRMYVLDTTA